MNNTVSSVIVGVPTEYANSVRHGSPQRCHIGARLIRVEASARWPARADQEGLLVHSAAAAPESSQVVINPCSSSMTCDTAGQLIVDAACAHARPRIGCSAPAPIACDM